MSSNSILQNGSCLNCGEPIKGSYCLQCGQKTRDNSDRSLTLLIGDFFGNLFFLDNRFFVSLKYLILKPGQMTVEFLAGKRKKFLPPVSLFLFANLVYFFISPITDFSLPLIDQVEEQPMYSPLAKRMVEVRLQKREVAFNDYARKYNRASDNISKTVIILNVPMIALFVYLISFKKRKFYFDSLIFSFHYFTMLLLFILAVTSATDLMEQLIGETVTTSISGVIAPVVIVGLPFLYLVISLKKMIATNWLLSVGSALFVLLGVVVSHIFYRGIIFFLTFYLT